MATTFRSVRPFGPPILALVIALGGCGPATPEAPVAAEIAYVGSLAQDQDRGFGEFSAALQRLPAAAAGTPRLRYYQGPADDPLAVRRAVADAARSPAAVLVTPTGDSTRAALALAARPPVVFSTFGDPVQQGLVDSLRLPGRRATGIALHDNLHLKRLEVLRDAFPRSRRVAVLVDRSWLAQEDLAGLIADARSRLGLEIRTAVADSSAELDALMLRPQPRVDAWYVPPTYLSYFARARIVEHLRRREEPSIHSTLEEVAHDGAPMAYTQDLGSERPETPYRVLAGLALRVARLEDAGTIPIERPRRFLLAVQANRAPPWARIAPDVVRRADRVY